MWLGLQFGVIVYNLGTRYPDFWVNWILRRSYIILLHIQMFVINCNTSVKRLFWFENKPIIYQYLFLLICPK